MSLRVVSCEAPEGVDSLGIDVSGFQRIGGIDWQAAARTVGWAVARVSCGAQVDPAGQAHIAGARAASLTVGAYHYVNEQPLERQRDAFLGQLEKVRLGPGDLAPVLDLEWIPVGGVPKLPGDLPGYCRIVDGLIEACAERYGGVMLYTASGFWVSVGSPASWLAHEWWCPWYPARSKAHPDRRLLESQAREHEWPKRPGVPTPAAWQFDALMADWSHCGEVDHNLARRLPIIVEE